MESIKETTHVSISLKSVIAVLIFVITGVWASAISFFSIRQDLIELRKAENWTLTDMERYSYRLGDLNRDPVALVVPDAVEVRRQRIRQQEANR